MNTSLITGAGPKKYSRTIEKYPTTIRLRKTLVQKIDQIVRDVNESKKSHLVDNFTLGNLNIFKSRNTLMHHILEDFVRDYEERFGVINVK